MNMTDYDDFELDAISEAREDAYQDALDDALLKYCDWLETNDLSEEDYSFDEFLHDLQNEPDDLKYYGYAG